MRASQEFLEELTRRLNKSLPKEVAEARLREVRSHLTASIAEDGEESALKRFGSAKATAQAIIRQARGFDSRSAASLSRTPGLVLALALTLAPLWMDWSMTPLSFLGMVWIPFFAVVLFAVRCYQTRRWLVLPAAGWSAIGFGLYFVLAGAFPVKLDASTSATQIRDAREAVAIWDRNQKEVDAWRTGIAPTDSAPYVRQSPTTDYIMGLPFGIRSSGAPVYDIDRFDHRQRNAFGSWDLYGKEWARTVADRRKSAGEYLAALQKGLARSPTPASEQFYFWKVAVGEIILILFASNALALLLGRLSDLRPKRHQTRRHPLTP